MAKCVLEFTYFLNKNYDKLLLEPNFSYVGVVLGSLEFGIKWIKT